MEGPRPEQEIVFRLPIDGWPPAVFEGPFGFDGGQLVAAGRPVLRAQSRADLERGVEGLLPQTGARISMKLVPEGHGADIVVAVDDRPALRQDRLRARPTRSAWLHAILALAGSAAGFVASALYLRQATLLHSDWALKMGDHMAGWHLLLTFTLFPASVWGQRIGIRAVQGIALLFFLIHAGIAIANLGPGDPSDPTDGTIAFFNAASGALFLAAALYGNRAFRDMDPVEALRRGRTTVRAGLTERPPAA
jgi:hypothetical protein